MIKNEGRLTQTYSTRLLKLTYTYRLSIAPTRKMAYKLTQTYRNLLDEIGGGFWWW